MQADVGGQRRLIVLGDEQVVGTALDDIVGDLALGEQGVGGEGLAGELDCVEYREGHADLIGLLDLVAGP